MKNRLFVQMSCRKEQGASLLVSLLVLLGMTMISIAGMNLSLIQEKMASNSLNYTRTFNGAEASVSNLTTQATGRGGVTFSNASMFLMLILAPNFARVVFLVKTIRHNRLMLH